MAHNDTLTTILDLYTKDVDGGGDNTTKNATENTRSAFGEYHCQARPPQFARLLQLRINVVSKLEDYVAAIKSKTCTTVEDQEYPNRLIKLDY